MKKSKIQWCDDTENPVMGCDGCELWPTVGEIFAALIGLIVHFTSLGRSAVREVLRPLSIQYESATNLWHRRQELIAVLSEMYPKVPTHQWWRVIEEKFRCYAGILHLGRGGRPGDYDRSLSPGHAGLFENPKKFPGRMLKAAQRGDLRDTARPNKPWLDGFPRLVFVSDMGDALSEAIDFDYLKAEIVDVATSLEGRRHVWLWLTKRPKRMSEFAEWLSANHGIEWPDNLVAMTSVTNRATRSRIDQLRKVPARLRGLSVEPLIESIQLDLDGIDWVIVGGESGNLSRVFDIEWARSLQKQCCEAGVAFFVKQLGANPVEDGFPVELVDSHGGDWTEWPDDLRVRELPETFRSACSEPITERAQAIPGLSIFPLV